MRSASTAPRSGWNCASGSAARVRSRAPTPEYYEPADPSRMPPTVAGDRRRGLRRPADRRLFLLVQQLRRDAGPRARSAGGRSAAAPAPAQPRRAARRRPPPASRSRSPPPARSGCASSTARRRQLFSGSLAAGQTYRVPATAQRPLIRTGRPQLLRASVGGRDLGPLAPEERTIDDVSLLPQDLAARAQPAPPAAPAGPRARPPAARPPAAAPCRAELAPPDA